MSKEKNTMSRRDFIKMISGVAAAAALLPSACRQESNSSPIVSLLRSEIPDEDKNRLKKALEKKHGIEQEEILTFNLVLSNNNNKRTFSFAVVPKTQETPTRVFFQGEDEIIELFRLVTTKWDNTSTTVSWCALKNTRAGKEPSKMQTILEVVNSGSQGNKKISFYPPAGTDIAEEKQFPLDPGMLPYNVANFLADTSIVHWEE